MPEEVAILFGLTLLSGTFLTLAWIVTRYLERRSARVKPDDPELLRQMDDMRGRLEGVEERLDFAERLLAQQRDRPALGGDR